MSVAFDIRTAPFSRWNVENIVDEPAHGYFARLVAGEGHSSIRRYAEGIGIDARYVNPEALMDVVFELPISDDQKERLRNATPIREGNRIRLAGQWFKQVDFSFSSRRWCPGCLYESPHHRAWWDIVSIGECPYHGHSLLDQDEHGTPVRWWWAIMGTSPNGAMLAKPLARIPTLSGD
jgi:hypothetical protein